MITNPLQILCWDQNSEYARLVSSVFSLIPHELRRVETDKSEFLSLVRQNSFDLIVIDNALAALQADDIKQLKSSNAAMEIILIEDDYKRAGDFQKIRHIRLLSKTDVVVKLAPLLSEMYSRISDRIYNGANYQKLLQQALEHIDTMVLVANAEGRVVFMNRAASKTLDIEDTKNAEIFMQSIVADGAKIWKFALDYLNNMNKPLQNYQVQFIDGHDQRHGKLVNFRSLALDKGYVLIDESTQQRVEPALSDEQDLSIIQRFSESISNELLNPVNVIFGRIQLLKQSMPKEKVLQKHIGGLEKQVERINETIKRLVTFASLRPDAVPQKVHLNELIERLKIDPAAHNRLNSFMDHISFKPGKDIPVLHGLLSHFDMLIKNILEMVFECAGSSGQVEIQTGHIVDRDKQKQVRLTFAIDYNKPVFGDARSLSNQLKEERTIEGSIVKYIIRSYGGVYQIKNETSQSEKLEIYFPVLDPYHKAEAK